METKPLSLCTQDMDTGACFAAVLLELTLTAPDGNGGSEPSLLASPVTQQQLLTCSSSRAL